MPSRARSALSHATKPAVSQLSLFERTESPPRATPQLATEAHRNGPETAPPAVSIEARAATPPSSRAPAPRAGLFDDASLAGPDERALDDEYAHARELAEKIPVEVRLGTSSWSFPGWHRLVYARRQTESQLAREGLAEYARHPLLRTVGIDRSYYAPIAPDELTRYAAQLPEGYPCCAKAPERVTSPIDRARRERNPDYLSNERFCEWVLEPFRQRFSAHTGPFVLEFPPLPREHAQDPRVFARELDGFLSRLPSDLRYAVELRDRALLTGPYARVLARHGVAHVYNYWRAMPYPVAQAGRAPVETADFVVVRLLHRPGTNYEQRKKAFSPFTRLHDVDDVMRRDVCTLIDRALAARRVVYVLVNNKAEGCAPRTVLALAEMLAAG